MSLTAIILAAGKSTRMKSTRPKVLHEVCGRPMLHYVLQAAFDVGCQRVLVVVGHGRDEVIAQFTGDERITWVDQTDQLGTGHAAQCCVPHLREDRGDVFILAGDGPLIRADVLRTLLDAHREDHAAASMATAMLDDPTGYGRVVRDEHGRFKEIVEEIDCSPEQRRIREVFPSYYCCRGASLVWALAQLRNDNKKGEYYLTDIYGHLRRNGEKVTAVQAVAAEDVLGINTRAQLADVDLVMQDRIQRALRDAGVTIVSGLNTYIESGVSIGADTVIHPFTFIGRSATIGARCVLGPFACLPRECIVQDGAAVGGASAGDAALLHLGPA